jgi:hypothetical protein
LSLAFLKYFAFPFLWISAVWAFISGLMIRRSRRPGPRVAWLNLGVAILVLGGVEAFAARRLTRDQRNSVHYPAGYMVRDEFLGTVPARGTATRVQRWHDSTLVYDVVYSIGPDGLRRSPPERGRALKGCALFFGDSFAFGEGLDDEQTVPYRVGVHTGGLFRIYNFGFHGYGAHQMLSALEHGKVESVIHCRPTHVVYSAIPQHVLRAAGVYAWGRHGPRYLLTPDGGVRHAGHFDDGDNRTSPPSPLGAKIGAQLVKSYLYRWFVSFPRTPTDQDVRRYLAIVTAAQGLVRQKFPGCRFDILLWPPLEGGIWDRVFQDVRRGLTGAGLQVHLVSNIIPEYVRDASPYVLPYDGHPNAHADDLVARYVAGVVLAMPALRAGSR